MSRPRLRKILTYVFGGLVVLAVLSFTASMYLFEYAARIENEINLIAMPVPTRSYSAEYHFNRGYYYQQQGDLERAFTEFTKAIGYGYSEASVFYLRGLISSERGDAEAALVDFNRALEIDPTMADAHFKRGMIHAAREELEAALADFDSYLGPDSQNEEEDDTRSPIDEESGDFDFHPEYFEQALALDPSSDYAYWVRGMLRAELGDYQAAIADFRRIPLDTPAAWPDYWPIGAFEWILRDWAEEHYRQGDVDAALAYYSFDIDLLPEKERLYLARGRIYLDTGDLASALADFNTASATGAAHNPGWGYAGRPEALRGLVYQRMGDYEAALADYEAAIELDWHNDFYDRYSALEDFTDEEVEYLLGDYDNILAVAPQDARVYYLRGLLYYTRLEDDPAALADLNRAVSLDPTYADAYYRRGLVYYVLGDIETALVNFDQAVALDTKYELVYFRMADRLFQEKPVGALLYLDRAVERVTPCDWSEYFCEFVYLRRGQVYEELGHLEAALADYEHFLTLQERRDVETDEVEARIEALRAELSSLNAE